MADLREIGVPTGGLVVLVGVTGSGKTTFAHTHFAPTEVLSSDACRAMVADDENDQSASADAFDVLHHIAGVRLRRGRLTVVDATNVQADARRQLVALAREHDALVDAIVLDTPTTVLHERTAHRADRSFGRDVVERQARDLRRTMKGIRKEGFRRVHVVAAGEDVRVVRDRPWNDRRDLTGPFDVIGDVHGCRAELCTLLERLGWVVERDGDLAVGAHHPQGRTAVFVGDLVDRGPDTPGVLRLVMGMVAAGTALCVRGNHEEKLVKALQGRQVTISHGLEASLAQLAVTGDELRTEALAFMDGLVAHYVLDGGRLVVAHAGLKESYHGRTSKRVRAFALYGDTTGETDEFGLPVRYPWAQEYRGAATVVYGHTPTTTPEWVNNTICLDTGAVFGGALTALRYPERELVQVPAERQWYEPTRPLEPPAPAEREPTALAVTDVSGTRWIETSDAGRVKIPEENAAAALEVMSRFAVDPRWLRYLPPTMSPTATSRREGYLEHPEEALTEMAAWGVTRVVCEEKHMGSRAIAVICRDEAAAERAFAVTDGTTGVVHTRTGRPFFTDSAVMAALVQRVQADVAPLFDMLDSDWVMLDCELLPWSAKALDLVRDQYASVGAAARSALPAALEVLRQGQARGLDVDALAGRVEQRLENANAFRDAYTAYCRADTGLDGITLAPFQVLAVEGRALAATEPHEWHMQTLAQLSGPALTPTRHRYVDLASDADRAAAVHWWEALTASGGEGMVVKPAHLVPPRVQPGLKVRGREYLRIIYGPDYLGSLDVLRDRNLGRKRSLASREHALGIDALRAHTAGDPLWRVHERVFGVLALESEPVDPRL